MADHQQNAHAALDALSGLARDAGIDDYAPCPPGVAEAELARGAALGAVPLFLGDPAYPALLAAAEEAPPMLWALGRTEPLRRAAIGIVGARNASSLGRRMARSLARDLGEAGLTVVSGLARGIDAEAHGAALATGTVAVVAGGVDVTYPRENADLMARIADQGLILSEMPPGLQPQARHFPRRNRIIAGLSAGLLVVEAAAKSGSLITARDAADLGRDVMAVPGHPFDPRAAGCNLLLRDGASLVRNAADVLEALGPAVAPQVGGSGEAAHAPSRSAAAPAPDSLPPDPSPTPGATHDPRAAQDRILALLGPAPVPEEQILCDTGLPPAALAECLTELELAGKLRRGPGGLLSLPG